MFMYPELLFELFMLLTIAIPATPAPTVATASKPIVTIVI